MRKRTQQKIHQELMAFNLELKSVFVTRSVTLGILFSTAVNDELVARPLILYHNLFFLTKVLTSGILF